MTPHDMPRRRPQHIWTPPANTRALPATPYIVELASPRRHNAKIRRAHRNGWARQTDDVN